MREGRRLVTKMIKEAFTILHQDRFSALNLNRFLNSLLSSSQSRLSAVFRRVLRLLFVFSILPSEFPPLSLYWLIWGLRGLDLVWESATPPTKILKNFPQKKFFLTTSLTDILGKPLPADSYEFLVYFKTGADPPPYFGNYLAIFLRKIPLNVCHIFSKRYEKCSKTTPKIYQKTLSW